MSRIVRTALILSLIFVISGSFPRVSAESKNLDGFAKCLSQNKVKMYGLFWCTHCADQKELFGSSFQYVTYVECGIPGTRKATDECKTAGIKHMPTWAFADGSRREGVVPLADLAKQSGCKLP
jgi:hypothetical protein